MASGQAVALGTHILKDFGLWAQIPYYRAYLGGRSFGV